MRVTGQERREVASLLRNIKRYEFGDGPVVDSYDFVTVLDLDWSNGCWMFSGCVDHVADLIDRPTCKMNYDSAHMDFVCSECGTFFDYPATNLEGKTRDFKYCPNCGAEVV